MKYAIERSADGEWTMDVWKRGHSLLSDSLLNKGSAFTHEERELFDLEGMLPTQVTDHRRQIERAYEHIQAKGDNPLEKYVGMVALQDRNETLFYRVLAGHIEELVPIVYTPTVGAAAVQFSHIFRRGRGLWITPEHRGRIFDVLGHARHDEVKLIVATDNERILGLGDQGAGGMGIPIGKLALYTLGAGIHPIYTLPIALDVGTDNPALLDDELYVGWHHPRLRDEPYDELIAEFVDAVRRRFPDAVLQWEDFKKANAFRLLDRYRTALPSFNDDIQGTAAVVLAGVLAAGRATGTKLADQRFVLAGAGASGVGIARQLRHALEAEGVSPDRVTGAVALVDTGGLVVADREGLDPYKREVAWPRALATHHGFVPTKPAHLEEVIARLSPTVLVGSSGQPGLFTDAMLRSMASAVERPVVLALSNPTSKCEAVPGDIAAWTDGRALIATGSPFDPVRHRDRAIPVSQCNNVYVFPGIGLGAIISRADEVTDAMFSAAATALAGLVEERDLARGVLYPPLAELRSITRVIAHAVAREAAESGVGAPLSDADIAARLDAEIWDLDYPTLRPV